MFIKIWRSTYSRKKKIIRVGGYLKCMDTVFNGGENLHNEPTIFIPQNPENTFLRDNSRKKKTYVEVTLDAFMHETIHEEDEQENKDDDMEDTEIKNNNVEQPGDEENQGI